MNSSVCVGSGRRIGLRRNTMGMMIRLRRRAPHAARLVVVACVAACSASSPSGTAFVELAPETEAPEVTVDSVSPRGAWVPTGGREVIDATQPTDDIQGREEPDEEDVGKGSIDSAIACSECVDIPVLASRTDYPIILAHGMAGFDSFLILEYWGGVQKHLRDAGFAVYTSVVEPLNGSDVRGAQLAAYVDRVLECTCSERVNIIAHSQGGIDARVLVDVLDYADRVDSVTTIATPHWGTPVADRVLTLVPGQWDPVVELLAAFVTGIYADPLESPEVRSAMEWCSTDFMSQFYEQHPPSDAVTWYSYAGRAGITANGLPECTNALLPNPSLKNALNAPFYPGWNLIGGLQGVDNDGLVPVESAKFGEFLGCIPADHVQEIGMYWTTLPLFDHKAFYLDHAERLEEWSH